MSEESSKPRIEPVQELPGSPLITTDLNAAARGPKVSPPPSIDETLEPPGLLAPTAGAPHARTLGMMAYALGVVLSVLAYLWAMTSSQSTRTPLASQGGFQAGSFYANWGIKGILFLLAILLMTLVGWLVAGRGTQLFSAGCRAESDTLGKMIGLLSFCGGIAMVVVVFMNTVRYFGTEPSLVPVPPPIGSVPPDYAAWALNGIFQLLVLALMALNGSLIAGRGVQLFLASFSTRESVSG